MTERRMKELAEEAVKRHKDDPAFARIISSISGQRREAVMTPSEAFWFWWNSWINTKASMHSEQSLAYKGKNDPTANAAIGAVMKELKKRRI